MTTFSPYSAQFAPAPVSPIPALIQDIGKELGCEHESHLHVLTKALEVIRSSKMGESQGEKSHNGMKQAQEPMFSSFQQPSNIPGLSPVDLPSPVFPPHQFPPMPNGFPPQMFPPMPRPGVRTASPTMNGYGQRMPPFPFPAPSFQEWQAMQAFRQQQQQMAQVSGPQKAQSPITRPAYRPHPYAFQQPARTVPQLRSAYSPEQLRQPISPIPEQNSITDAQLAELDAFFSKDCPPKTDHQTTQSVFQSRPVHNYHYEAVSKVHCSASQEEGPKQGISDEELAELNEYCRSLKRDSEGAVEKKREEERPVAFDNGIDRDILNEFLSFA